jgi:hypothetical protein
VHPQAVYHLFRLKTRYRSRYVQRRAFAKVSCWSRHGRECKIAKCNMSVPLWPKVCIRKGDASVQLWTKAKDRKMRHVSRLMTEKHVIAKGDCFGKGNCFGPAWPKNHVRKQRCVGPSMDEVVSSQEGDVLVPLWPRTYVS